MRRLTFMFDAGLDPQAYAERWSRGLVPDRAPYGIENAPPGWTFDVVDVAIPPVLHHLSQVLGARLGFDIVHAFLNRRKLRCAEVVYCHTEVEYLAAAVVLLGQRRRRTVLVGHTIWLFRRFGELGRARRHLYRWLLRRVDLFIANAGPNRELGVRIAPSSPHHFVPFGVSRVFDRRRMDGGGPDVLGVGNDAARDWDTFSAAAAQVGGLVRVASKFPVDVAGVNVSRPTSGLAELLDLYGSASVVVVSVLDNAHASGITTLLEAVAGGAPCVATATGGLEDYFSDDEVSFVPVSDVQATAASIRALLGNRAEAEARARRARARMERDGYWNDDYWKRIVDVVSSLPGAGRRGSGAGAFRVSRRR